jgi:hypothetical protein
MYNPLKAGYAQGAEHAATMAHALTHECRTPRELAEKLSIWAFSQDREDLEILTSDMLRRCQQVAEEEPRRAA